ncbi:MAG: CHAT domain-containing tetratricopeptide repeat protein, partial [Bacteroidota bacterium]
SKTLELSQHCLRFPKNHFSWAYLYYDYSVYELQVNNLEQSIYWNQQAIEQAQSSRPIEQGILIEAKLLTSWNYNKMGKLDTAIAIAQQILDDTIWADSLRPQLFSTYLALGAHLNEAGKHEQALAYFRTSIQEFEPEYGANHLDIATLYEHKGITFQRMFEIDSMDAAYKRTLEIRKKVLGPTHFWVGKSYNALSISYGRQGFWQKAVENQQFALDIMEKSSDGENYHLAAAYYNMGYLYGHLGDFKEQVYYGQKAVQLTKNPSLLATVYHAIADGYTFLKVPHEAEQYFLKSLATYSTSVLPYHRGNLQVLMDLGTFYLKQGQSKRADSVFKLTFQLMESGLASLKTSPQYGRLLGKIAGLKAIQGHYEEALELNQEAIEVLARYPSPTISNRANIHLSRAEILRKLGRKEEALQACNQSLAVLLSAGDTLSSSQPPTASVLKLYPVISLFILSEKAQLLNTYPDPGSKHTALELFLLADSVIDAVRSGLSTPDAQKYLAENAAALYEDGLEFTLANYQASSEAKYAEHAFTFMEKSRSLLLLEGIQESKAQTFAGIPANILARDQHLKTRILHTQNKLQALTSHTSQRDSIVALWQNRAFDLRRAHQSLLDTLEQLYPQYYQLKYAKNLYSLPEVQQGLALDQVLLSYFWGKKHAYVLAISSTEFFFKKYDSEQMTQKIQTITSFASQRVSFMQDRAYSKKWAAYQQDGYALYNLLLKGPLEGLGTPVHEVGFSDSRTYQPPEKRIIVLPDGPLYQLPFDALIVSPHPETPIFTVTQYQIQHAFSASLFMDSETSSKASKVYAGFAPAYKRPSENDYPTYAFARGKEVSFNPLRYNQESITQAAKLWNGQAFKGQKASRNRFLKEADDYQVLHLGVHAFSNNQNPDYSGLAFATDTLEVVNANELYQMKLRADLAVLSACYTGTGKWVPGEGVYSLARGFRFAGCKNVVTSLWQADDKAATEMVQYFFDALKSGKDQAESLRMAKLTYLSNSDPLRAHPYHWGTFVLMGENKPISLKTGQSASLWGFAFLGLIAILWMYSRRK